MRSFRAQLSLRFTAAMAVALGAAMTVGYLALRETLDRELEASILSVASIQASSSFWASRDRKSTRLNSSHRSLSRMPSSA